MPPPVSPNLIHTLRLLGRWLYWMWAPIPLVVIGLLISGHLPSLCPGSALAQGSPSGDLAILRKVLARSLHDQAQLEAFRAIPTR